MKRFLMFLLALCLVLPATGLAEDTAPDYTTGKPWLCSDLVGNVTADTPAELKDDFYLAVNKDALLKLEIPDGYPLAGTVLDLISKQASDLKTLFANADPQTHDEHLAVDLYNFYMDWDTRNALGVSPLKKQTDTIEAIGSLDELTAYFVGTPMQEQPAALFRTSVEISRTDASRYDLSIVAPSILMSDSAEYAQMTDYGKIRLEAGAELITKMLTKMGCSEDEAAVKWENCLAFEHLIAPSIPTSAEQKRPDYDDKLVKSTMDRDTLAKTAGSFPLTDILEGSIGYPALNRYVPDCGDYITKLAGIYTEENLPLIKDFLIVHGIIDQAQLLDRECYDWKLEYNNRISGSSGTLDDETMSATYVEILLKWPVAQLYCSTYISPEDKERITAIVDKSIDAYHGIIMEADFLSEETKAGAIEKLDTLSKNILYPDDWSVYGMEELDFIPASEGGSLTDAVTSIYKYDFAQNARKLIEPVDKTRWEEYPTTVNCFYNPSANEIYICAAFAHCAMYSPDMCDEQIMAAIGIVIGHEISHAFDSHGSQFDKDGNLNNWWTEEDYARFGEKNKKLEAYYDNISVWDGMPVDGSIVTGETCADMGGLKCMLRIASGIENFDYDLFFRTYAVVWISINMPQRVLAMLKDEHPLGYIRCNTSLQQFDEFLDFYGIKEGDGMYLAPEDRVAIW